jgi:hypothetical protein
MRRRRRGYVLVVTLGLLVLAATLMVSVGRASLRRAAAAREAADDLQRRWGATSCRLAVMPAIESVLVDQERKVGRPVALHRARLRLGGQTFDVVLADEQAKANVNALLDEADRARVETRLREAMTGSGMGQLVRVRPDPSVVPIGAGVSGGASTAPATQPLLAHRVTGLGQVFDNVPPERLIGASELITCWGSGRVNVRRAMLLEQIRHVVAENCNLPTESIGLAHAKEFSQKVRGAECPRSILVLCSVEPLLRSP